MIVCQTLVSEQTLAQQVGLGVVRRKAQELCTVCVGGKAQELCTVCVCVGSSALAALLLKACGSRVLGAYEPQCF